MSGNKVVLNIESLGELIGGILDIVLVLRHLIEVVGVVGKAHNHGSRQNLLQFRLIQTVLAVEGLVVIRQGALLGEDLACGHGDDAMTLACRGGKAALGGFVEIMLLDVHRRSEEAMDLDAPNAVVELRSGKHDDLTVLLVENLGLERRTPQFVKGLEGDYCNRSVYLQVDTKIKKYTSVRKRSCAETRTEYNQRSLLTGRVLSNLDGHGKSSILRQAQRLVEDLELLGAVLGGVEVIRHGASVLLGDVEMYCL